MIGPRPGQSVEGDAPGQEILIYHSPTDVRSEKSRLVPDELAGDQDVEDLLEENFIPPALVTDVVWLRRICRRRRASLSTIAP